MSRNGHPYPYHSDVEPPLFCWSQDPELPNSRCLMHLKEGQTIHSYDLTESARLSYPNCHQDYIAQNKYDHVCNSKEPFIFDCEFCLDKIQNQIENTYENIQTRTDQSLKWRAFKTSIRSQRFL
jgi:hypothetical protein